MSNNNNNIHDNGVDTNPFFAIIITLIVSKNKVRKDLILQHKLKAFLRNFPRNYTVKDYHRSSPFSTLNAAEFSTFYFDARSPISLSQISGTDRANP